MASNSSGPLSPGESYTLGQYTFTIDSQYDSEGDTTYITADCNYGEDAGVKQTTVDGEVEIESWHVECSDDAADVYATYKVPVGDWDYASDLDTSPVTQPINGGGKFTKEDTWQGAPRSRTIEVYYNAFSYINTNDNSLQVLAVSKTQGDEVPTYVYTTATKYGVSGSTRTTVVHNGYTYDGKTAWWSCPGLLGISAYECHSVGYVGYLSYEQLGKIAWTMLYGVGEGEYEEKEVFVARFAINPEDADVEDWDDPIDDGDPELTLKLTVRGALSGRHNDPIYDTSYSYTPADNPTVKDYGCGGDGGYGGGGGAGASTVIINKFATSQAGSHESYAYARRHGYGSGGGKGGRGGDGCIIIYW